MTPRFAISLGSDALGLLLRGADGWAELAALSLDDPDLRGALARMRRAAVDAGAPEDGSVPVIAILPRDVVRLVDGRVAPRLRPVAHEALRAEIRTLADGMTPYPIDALAIDWTAGRGQDEVQIALVARETLEEGRAFLLGHGFDPVAFAALRHPGRYDATAWFAADGISEVAEFLRAETTLDQRASAAPETVALPSALQEPEIGLPPQEQDETAETRDEPPVASPPARGHEPPAPPVRPILAPARAGRPSTPAAGFRIEALKPFLRHRPALAVVAALALLAVISIWALRPEGEATDAIAPSAATSPESEPPSDETAAAQFDEGAAGARDTGAATQATSDTVAGSSEPVGAGQDASSLPAEAALATPTAPTTNNPAETRLDPDQPPFPAETAAGEPGAEAPTAAQPDAPVAAPPTEQAEPAGATDLATATATAAAPAETMGTILPAAPVDSAGTTEPTAPAEAVATSPAPPFEGLAAPSTADAPSGAEALTITAGAAVPLVSTAVLPEGPPRLAADTVPGQVALPPPYGVIYSFDAQGRILPTPEGVLTPEGFLLVAGRPPLPPLPRPATAQAQDPAETALAAPLANPALAAAATAEQITAPPRPVARPAALLRVPDPLPGSRPAPARPASILAAAPPAEVAEGVDPTASEEPNAPETAAPEAAATSTSPPDARIPGPPVPLPRARPASIAALATAPVEAEAADAAASALAVAIAYRPSPRPDGLAERAAARSRTTEVATDDTEAAESGEIVESDLPEVRPSAEAAGVVAKKATVARAIDLEEMSLIGVFGTERARYALVRQPNGRIARVKVGDRLDGGRVVAIGDTELRYQKSGNTLTLRLPRG
jgi:hypothetical protein